ncbi:unnamed protein product [Dovyalis caffra]|uniref:Uncharacterized protein n=1 Tax=Dovyalis caffra TaxID=77055 RepID=A0AAV1RZV4_9ROSI|nr:unnamed protein product [Dovyalis caffra]
MAMWVLRVSGVLGVSCEGLGEKGVSENEKGSGEIGNLKAKMGVVDSHGNMALGANEGSCSNSLEKGDGNVGDASGGVHRQHNLRRKSQLNLIPKIRGIRLVVLDWFLLDSDSE